MDTIVKEKDNNDGENGYAPREVEQVPFHRHCQKTVCSAYGHEGDGATWSALVGASVDGLLPLYDDAYEDDSAAFFQDKFGSNNHITHDLASIISLVNDVARKASKGVDYAIIFLDSEGREIVDSSNSRLVVSQEGHGSVKLGRIVELQWSGSDGENPTTFARFNTMQKDDANDQLIIPLTKFTFKNGSTSFALNLPSNATNEQEVNLTDISQDPNVLVVEELDSSASALIVQPGKHVYRKNLADGGFPQIDLSEYNTILNDIICFEFHAMNNTTSTIALALPEYGDYRVVGLTDQMEIPPKCMNAYVIRIDKRQETLTYSLAYQMDFSDEEPQDGDVGGDDGSSEEGD